MKKIWMGCLSAAAILGAACGADQLEPSLASKRAAVFMRPADMPPNLQTFNVGNFHTYQDSGRRLGTVLAVYRTPSGNCALGSGPMGSPNFLSGLLDDQGKCRDMCGGASNVDGMRAVDDGDGGCKLQCDCAGDGLGYIDFDPAIVQPPTP